MRFLLILASFLFVGMASCQQKNQKVPISKVIEIPAAEQLIASDAELQILDVRTPEEYAEGHLKGCTLMNIFDEDFSEKLKTLEKEKPVIVYCRSGSRSADAASIMREMGFKEVYDLKGGIKAWTKAGMGLEK